MGVIIVKQTKNHAKQLKIYQFFQTYVRNVLNDLNDSCWRIFYKSFNLINWLLILVNDF